MNLEKIQKRERVGFFLSFFFFLTEKNQERAFPAIETGPELPKDWTKQ